MAIAIDLLPGYVGKEKLFKRLLMVAVVVVVAVGAMLYAKYYQNQQLLHKYNEEADLISPYAEKAKSVQSSADAAVSAAAPMQAAISFMADASKTGPQRGALLNLISKYIYYQEGRGAVISLMDISDGATVKLTATMDTTQDYNNFVYMLRSGSAKWTPPGPLWADQPTAGGIPGFPSPPPKAGASTTGSSGSGYPGGSSGAQAGTPVPGEPYIKVFPFIVPAQGTLKNKVVLPPDPVGGGAPTTGGGSGGYPGSQ